MARYVDSFVVPVQKSKMEAYTELAELSAKVWMEHGALEYVECVAQDVKPGEHTSYPQALKLKDDETVVVAWAIYKSRAHRDEVMKAVFEDPRMKPMMENMPFDGKRMFWGGFETFIEK